MDMENDTVSRRTIRQLLDYIRTRRLRPGDFLPPGEALAAQFGVSRVILREAFSYLKALGVVTSRRGSGFKVAEVGISAILERVLTEVGFFTGGDMRELYELRRALELGLIYDAVTGATAADRQELRAALEELERFAQPGHEAEIGRFNAAELRFHQAMLRPAHCRTIELINSALAEFFQLRYAIAPAPRLTAALVDRTNASHRAMVECFELKNPDAALALLRDHLKLPACLGVDSASGGDTASRRE